MFATMRGMICLMMQACELNNKKKLKKLLSAECANIATQVINIILSNSEDNCSFEQVYRKIPKWCQLDKLRAFEQICVITKKTIQGKLKNRVSFESMVGYSEQHAIGTYRIFILDTMRTIDTRDVRWLNMYFGICLEGTKGIANAPDLSDNKQTTNDNNNNNDNGFLIVLDIRGQPISTVTNESNQDSTNKGSQTSISENDSISSSISNDSAFTDLDPYCKFYNTLA